MEGVAEPGQYTTPRWGGVGGLGSIPIVVTLTDPMTTGQYGLSDCCGVYPRWGRAFWPEPIPTWMEPFMGWNEDDDRVELVAPLLVVYRLTHFYPSGDADDGSVAVADVDGPGAMLADHPALVEPTQPTAMTIGGYEGVRVESAFSGTLGECGQRETGVLIRCLIGLDWEGSSKADWRFRTDIVRIGDEVIVLQTRLYPDAEGESKAIADAIIEGIEFPTA